VTGTNQRAMSVSVWWRKEKAGWEWSSPRPSDEAWWHRHAVGIFERRRRLLPGTMLHKAPPQSLTARQQTVMGVRERKQRQEGEGLSATGAATAPDLDPIMVYIVACLRRCPWPMIESRSQRASPQDDIGAACRPIGFELSGETESGINRIVLNRGSAPPASTCQDQSRKQSSFLLKRKIQLEENTALASDLLRV